MNMLDRILAPEGIRCFGQPIYEIVGAELRLYGVELLSRGPVGTPFESPCVFFDYARRKRAESVVDRHAVEIALRATADVLPDVRLSINVHASTLGRDCDFVANLLATAQRVGTDPKRLTVEIVEHAPIWNRPEFALALQRLRDAGVQIALDDFGIGYSNFQMVLDVRPNILKADRYLVSGCDRDRDRTTMLAALRNIAVQLGGKLLAEGVETPSELLTVRQLGIELVQGYAVGHAVPVAELAQYPRLLSVPSASSGALTTRARTFTPAFVGTGVSDFC